MIGPLVIDLFAGCGGLSLGFAIEGFMVWGVDINVRTPEIFELNGIGRAVLTDLSKEYVTADCDVLVGGPPCRPWSLVNRRKRGSNHPDAELVKRFFDHVIMISPPIFIMENVPPAKKYILQVLREKKIDRVYNIDVHILCYGDWGAPTRRKRLFVVGTNRNCKISIDALMKSLLSRRKNAMTVREAFSLISRIENDPEHVFFRPKTIDRYLNYYRTGKYGWYVLKWDEPAPSFGNVTKTYILHPAAFNGGPVRVISVREALLIMGFPPRFRFPDGMGVTSRYQMVADAVSPVFSSALAKTIREVLF